MILTSEKLVAYDLCPRRYNWTNIYYTRVSLIRALYIGLNAGLRTQGNPERTAENELLALASAPGLDVVGGNVYAVAMHYAKLAGIVAAALRSAWSEPWTPVEPIALPGGHEWHSACYRTGDGQIRRIALVDRWSDDRKQQETGGWRTIGEVCAMNRPILVTAVSIGIARDKRRHAAWTRCWRHPRNRIFRFQRKTSTEDFSKTWNSVWREDSGITTEDWLRQMHSDGCMDDLIHTVHVPVLKGKDDYLRDMTRIADEMASLPETPPMRISGCHGWQPCPFLGVCPNGEPGHLGFVGQRSSGIQ